MENGLDIISRIKNEHQRLKLHVKLVGDSVNDQEALATLHRMHANTIPGQFGDMSEKQSRLLQSISYLSDGLENHFHFEEKALPPLFGDLLIRALSLEHNDIREEIHKANGRIKQFSTKGINRDESLSDDAEMQNLVDGIRQTIEGHASREEAILDMLEKGLKSKQSL